MRTQKQTYGSGDIVYGLRDAVGAYELSHACTH